MFKPIKDKELSNVIQSAGMNTQFIPVGIKETYMTNAESGVVQYTLVSDVDMTFTEDVDELILIIPDNIWHGFIAGVNFHATKLTFVNNSEFALKRLLRGHPVDDYQFKSGKTVNAIITCDGLNVYCNLLEV